MTETERQANIDVAIDNLNNYINSLSPAKKEQAIAFQANLVISAAKHKDGMLGAIADSAESLRIQLSDATERLNGLIA